MFELRFQVALMIVLGLLIAGCNRSILKNGRGGEIRGSQSGTTFTNIELANISDDHCSDRLDYQVKPRSIKDGVPENFRNITLDDVIQQALQSPKVLRSLGAQVLSNPQGSTTRFDPAIQESNPNFGVEAALAQFDAQLTASLNYQKNDDVFNNVLVGGGANEVQQDLVTGQMELAKTTATGMSMALRSTTSHDFNNAPQNLFNHSWTSLWEAEIRQPLLQGGGLQFNRIAGPNGQPGFRFSNGVLISRVNHDISIAQFEQGVRDFVFELTTSYWRLHQAYQNHFTLKKAKEASLQTLQIVEARFEKGIDGGEKDRVAQAREQHFEFQQRFVAALNGDRSGQTGLLQSEADLRRLMGLPQNDGAFLRPIDPLLNVATIYDWDTLTNQALSRRVELRQQKWRIKQRELELLASRNFLLPRLDVVGTFRNNGFGDDLVGGGSGRFSSALKDLASGNHNELAFGVQYNAPVGFRQAHVAVRNAELGLCREKAILEEQKQQILHDLGSSLRLVESKLSELEFARGRVSAAGDTVEARTATYERDLVALDVLLEAQRRLADAELAYHLVSTDYALAQASLNRESGKLLSVYRIHLSEEDPCVDCTDDQKRWFSREQKASSGGFAEPAPVSNGIHAQFISKEEHTLLPSANATASPGPNLGGNEMH